MANKNTSQARYDKANTKGYYIKLNLKTDKELIEFLDKLENRQGFIKKALSEYIK